MILRDLLDLTGKKKLKKERVKAAQKLALGVGIGAALGVTTGVLLAPKSGKETRKDIKIRAASTVDTIKEKVQEQSETIKHSAAQASEKVHHAINEIHGKKEKLEEPKCDSYDVAQDTDKSEDTIADDPNRTEK